MAGVLEIGLTGYGPFPATSRWFFNVALAFSQGGPREGRHAFGLNFLPLEMSFLRFLPSPEVGKTVFFFSPPSRVRVAAFFWQ